MKSTLFAIIATLAVGTAQAQDGTMSTAGNTGSEFFYQTAAGQSDVTVGADYLMLSTNTGATGATDNETSGFALRAAYEYGLSEMLSLGAQLRYGMLTAETGGAEFDANGLFDPEIFLKGTSAMGTGNLRYGATLGLGLQKKKSATVTDDGNLASGGFSITPYVGYDMGMGPGILGARLSYGYMLERTTESAAGDTKSEGGNVLGLSAFYEYMMADALLGGAINFRSIGDTENAAGTSNNDAYSPLGLSIYSRIPVSNFVLLPSLDYDFSAGGDAYEDYSDMTLSVAARFGF